MVLAGGKDKGGGLDLAEITGHPAQIETPGFTRLF
jgi:hypothetical protein